MELLPRELIARLIILILAQAVKWAGLLLNGLARPTHVPVQMGLLPQEPVALLITVQSVQVAMQVSLSAV
jgi:hypothetical protein